jgi:hypothetical protein
LPTYKPQILLAHAGGKINSVLPSLSTPKLIP